MISNEFYVKLLKRRRPWTPVELSENQVLPNVEGVEDCVGKCLALRKLELQVGEWVESASIREKRYLTPEVRELLRLNIEDEDRHDRALGYAYERLKHLVTPEIEAEAEGLIRKWLNAANTVHPLEVVWTLESSVFFIILPIFRRLGSVGLRTVANDISNDEAIHVAAHKALAQEVGANSGTVRVSGGYGEIYYNSVMDELRAATVEWITQKLSPESRSGSGFWRFQSENLYYTGKAAGLRDTGRSVYQAFFEKSNSDLPKYA